jgi:hypothetical protein
MCKVCYLIIVPNNTALVDHRRRFIDLAVGWPGSVADRRIWDNSVMKANLEELLQGVPPSQLALRDPETQEIHYEEVPAFILADSAYPSNRRVVPTYRTMDCHRSPVVKKLNARLSSIRYCVEHAFGICKMRFRILQDALECARDDVTQATRLITAIMTVHNFIIDYEGYDEEDEEELGLRRNNLDEDNENIDDSNDNMESDDEDMDTSTRDILLRYESQRERS